MKLIDKLIKILINFKYRRDPFMAWSWGIDDTHEINVISAEYDQDHCRYGTREESCKVITNRDKINGMSNEELAKLINDPRIECKCCLAFYEEEYPCDDCRKGIAEWLESEVVNNDE